MDYGVLLTRAQPFHLGHIDVLKRILEENQKALIVIGSSNKSGTVRNPFSVDLRKFWVEKAIHEDLDANSASRVKLMTLCDWSMENAIQYKEEWGRFLYYNIVNCIETKKFAFYYNDGDTANDWFRFCIDRVEIKSFERSDISSTKIRKSLLAADFDYVKSCMPKSSWDSLNIMQGLIKDADAKDFIMN